MGTPHTTIPDASSMREHSAQAGQFGLLAEGSHLLWAASIDEALDSSNVLIAEIEGPQVYLTFQLKSIDVAKSLKDFLAQCRFKNSNKVEEGLSAEPLVLGCFDECEVSIVRDNEETGRCFLIVAGEQTSFRITLDGEAVASLSNVFEQITNIIN